MSFSELKDLYSLGKIDKQSYIDKALGFHQALFSYVPIIRSTDVRRICIDSEGVSFVIGENNIRLYFPEGEARVAPIEIINFSSYEPEETRVMDILSADVACILDIGANIGWYAVYFAKRSEKSRVYAFEPLPRSFKYLQRNISANAVGDRVMSFNYGLSDTCGIAEFFIVPSNGTNASLKNVAGSGNVARVIGATLTLDQWVANHDVAPDFIKCDVEGAEYLVFRGGRNTLETYTPIVFTELLRKWAKPFGYHPNDVLMYFRELGYCCFAVGVKGVRLISEVTEDTEETNYAFLHNRVHASVIRMLESLL